MKNIIALLLLLLFGAGLCNQPGGSSLSLLENEERIEEELKKTHDLFSAFIPPSLLSCLPVVPATCTESNIRATIVIEELRLITTCERAPPLSC